ncbi:putative ABC-type ATPase [Methylobacterium sp. BE186]|nr:zeta toxin family protein [Methylobacterium sp. BE186]MDR7040633.1 putative ABC-type ATPase [Methylobacterium sp. BE186]
MNADVIARASALGQAEAARRTIERLDDLLNGRKSFVYETTLSSHQAIALMGRARAVGYEVGLVYVALVDADLNVRRVAERVSRGGHDIPEATIRRRYPRALSNVARAVPLAHGSLFYDNSEPTPALLLRISDGVIEENNLKDACAHHRPIAEAVARALSVDADAIFRAAREGGAVRR